MIRGARTCVVALILIGVSGCSGGGANDETTPDGSVDATSDQSEKPVGPSDQLCMDVCEVVSSVQCAGLPPLEECVGGCTDPGAPCPVEETALDECVVAHGTAALMCAGSAVRIAAFCDDEGLNLAKCLSMQTAASGSALVAASPRRAWHSILRLPDLFH